MRHQSTSEAAAIAASATLTRQERDQQLPPRPVCCCTGSSRLSCGPSSPQPPPPPPPPQPDPTRGGGGRREGELWNGGDDRGGGIHSRPSPLSSSSQGQGPSASPPSSLIAKPNGLAGRRRGHLSPLLSALLLVLAWSCGRRGAEALRIQDVTFPGYAMLGQTVTMVCEYTMDQGEYVDSVKWYKDGAEFYRIVPNTPREQDKVVVFPRPGVRLDREKSGVS